MSEDTKDNLDAVRARIDAIDREIVRLLNERAAGAMQVARIKATEDKDNPPVFYRPEREAQILERVVAENAGPLTDRDLWRLFREIISCCLSLEQPLTVAYLGPPGTYTEAAVVKHFGHFAINRSQNSIDEVFREVESGAAHCGVVPVENSTEGMVNHTLDCFMASRLRICGEVELSINHAFMSLEDQDAITTVYSHEQSLAQCRRWLDRHYPNAAHVPMVSNAEAARVAARTSGAAAIAGEMAAETYGLRVLATNIEDESDNKTRFPCHRRSERRPKRQGQDLPARVDAQRVGSAVSDPRTLSPPRRQPDAHRNASIPREQLELHLLHRFRRS